MTELGNRIAALRKVNNVTQVQLAEAIGVSDKTVSKWETGGCYPDISLIPALADYFSVTTDYILRGVPCKKQKQEEDDAFVCGVYRSSNSEIVETEKFALIYYSNAESHLLGTRLYLGFGNKKRLVAICEHKQKECITEFAYLTEEQDVIFNCEALSSLLGEFYDSQKKHTMRRLEAFLVDHSRKQLPSVREAGIPKCLTLWRMADSYYANADSFNFFLCTGKTEYIFSIMKKDTNIYCGASYNIVFDLGMFGGKQFFRIRNYKDNSERFCRFYCDFSYDFKSSNIPTEQCELGKCIETNQGLMWCVKRYTDDIIVLQGCGDDEYTYRRFDKRTEQFVPEAL